MRWIALLTAAAFATAPAIAEERTIETDDGAVLVETVADGLDNPWGIAFLPDGRMLVTEKPGNLRIVGNDGGMSDPLGGLPTVHHQNQGGLLHVALDPDFEQSRLVYLSYAEPGEGGASTAVARGRLAESEDALENTEVIFRQEPKVSGGQHFGSRLAFSPDGMLFVTLGDRGQMDPAQDLSSHIGKMIRLNPDGSVPPDNPFVGRDDAKGEIWSYGHRNIQGAAVHPQTGDVWIHEMGPRGGDELNIPESGQNYGWPLVSWGRHYGGRDIPDPPTRPEFADAIHHWTPVISPSGMTFYTGEAFAGWRGDILIGGLSSRGLVRVKLNGERVAGEERLDLGTRIRDVAEGPDGAVYVLTDGAGGKILRLTVAEGG